jgi:hypothetical protein
MSSDGRPLSLHNHQFQEETVFCLSIVNRDPSIRLTALGLGLTLTRVHVRLMRTAADLRLRTVLAKAYRRVWPSPSPTPAEHLLLPSQLPTPPPPPPLARAPSNTVQQALIPQQHYL